MMFMKKIYTTISLAVLTLLGSFSAIAQYDAGDTTALGVIRDNNFSAATTLGWTDADPGNWMGVVWDTTVTPYRVVELNLSEAGTNGGSGSGDGSSCNDVPGGINYPTNAGNAIAAWTVTGATTNLTGALDLTAFSEITKIVLNSNDEVTDADVSGLTKLEFLFLGNTNIRDVDASGLTSLLQLKCGRNRYSSLSGGGISSFRSVNASGCTSLLRLKASWNVDSLESINIDNCTSILKLSAKRSDTLNSLSMSNVTTLMKIAIGSDGSTRKGLTLYPAQLEQNTNLRVLGIGFHNMAGVLDLSVYDSLYKVGAPGNNFSEILGASDSSLVNLQRVYAWNNRLQLTNAVDIEYNNLTPGRATSNASGQQVDGGTILSTDSIDYSGHDTIDVNGTAVASVFTLYDNTGATVSSNSTGIFNFTAADTGAYYVIMSNSGITVTTDSIYVVSAASQILTSIDVANFGDVGIGNTKTQVLTVSNGGNAALDVSNITLPTGYTIDGTTANLAGGASTTFNVTFTPTMIQTYAGDVVVASNATLDGGTDWVAVTGNGIDITGITEETAALVRFYPNPTKDVLFIENNKGSFETLSLYNAQGRLIKTVKLNGSAQINFTQMESGVYFIRSIDGKINQRIVKH